MVCINVYYHIAGNFGEVFNLAIWQIRKRSPNKKLTNIDYCMRAYGAKNPNNQI